MDTSRVSSLLETLDDEIDDLEEALSPLVNAPLSQTASKLPLLDKAKLYVLVTYAIESMLFSYLRLHGVKAREHPVFTELNRVKQYFQKLKVVETPVNASIGKRENLALDKAAAQRIIAAGLSGNDKYDLERAEQQAKERARAHIKFREIKATMKQDEIPKKRKAEVELEMVEDKVSSDSDSDSESASSGGVMLESPGLEASDHTSHKEKKKQKLGKKNSLNTSDPMSGVSSPANESKKREKREKKRKRKKDKVKKDK